MAISWGAMTFSMTDAEFLRINGVASPTIPVGSPFYGFGLTVASSAGTTTLTLPTGKKDEYNIRRLATLLRRLAQSYYYTYTP